KLLGMRENTSFTLVTGMTIGLAFGAGVMIQAVEEDGVSIPEMTLALLCLVTCHGVVEDTVIFMPLGIRVWPLFAVRFLAAVILTIAVFFVWNKVEKKKRRNTIVEEY